jgi:hypothetical protein
MAARWGIDAWRNALEGWGVVKSTTVEKIREEGRLEEKREDILELLRGKFKQEPPADLAERIRQCEDLAQLRDWFTTAVNSETMSVFRHDTHL